MRRSRQTEENSLNDAPHPAAAPAPPPVLDGPYRAPRPSGPPDFSRREFDLPERLDGPCTYADWRTASLDLARLNRLTHAYKPTLEFLDRVVTRTGVGFEPLHIVDAGCGHGDTLREIYRWARKRSLPLLLTGMDLNPYAARLARERDRAESVPAGAIAWVTADVFEWLPAQPVDLFLSSLFTHHLSDADILRFLNWCQSEARVGWFHSDLRRSARAARVAGWLTRLLRLHPSLQHDTPLSFRRALNESDWQTLLAEVGTPDAQIRPGRGKLFIEHIRSNVARISSVTSPRQP